MTSLRGVALIALIAASTACGGGDPTQLVVRVESDLEVPRELDRVVVRVEGPEECGQACLRSLPLSGPSALPLSFGVAPRDGDARRRVRLDVEGWRGDALVVRRTASIGFVANEVRLLVMRLESACAARATCEPDLTCEGGECIPVEVDVRALPRVAPGEELASRDGGGPMDAGTGEGGSFVPPSCDGLPDGPQTIDPDGEGGLDRFETWCQAGWTLLLKADGDQPGLGYHAEEWGSSAPIPFGSSRPDTRENAMLASYWRLPIRRLRVVMTEGAMAPRSLEVPIEGLASATPLAEVMRDGSATLDGDLGAWASLVGGELGPADAYLCRSTIPAQVPDAAPVVRVRLGVVVAGDPSCSPVLGWAGVGASTEDQSGEPCDTFAHTAGGARLCGNPRMLRQAHSRFTVIYGRD